MYALFGGTTSKSIRNVLNSSARRFCLGSEPGGGVGGGGGVTSGALWEKTLINEECLKSTNTFPPNDVWRRWLYRRRAPLFALLPRQKAAFSVYVKTTTTRLAVYMNVCVCACVSARWPNDVCCRVWWGMLFFAPASGWGGHLRDRLHSNHKHCSRHDLGAKSGCLQSLVLSRSGGF